MDFTLRLYRSRYFITITRRYAGAIAQTAIGPQKGRGRDLHDGKPWKLATFPKIIWDIICYEFEIGRFGWRYARKMEARYSSPKSGESQ